MVKYISYGFVCACVASTGFAASCPEGMVAQGEGCVLQMNGAAKEKMLQQFMKEGPGGETYEKSMAYIEKTLGKETAAKLQKLYPEKGETTDDWFTRLKAWRDRLVEKNQELPQ